MRTNDPDCSTGEAGATWGAERRLSNLPANPAPPEVPANIQP